MICASITGNLVADATERTGNNNVPIVCFRLASHSGRKKSGETVTDFIQCEIRHQWGPTTIRRLVKSARVFVTGELGSFRHNDGGLDLELTIDKLQFLDRSHNG